MKIRNPFTRKKAEQKEDKVSSEREYVDNQLLGISNILKELNTRFDVIEDRIRAVETTNVSQVDTNALAEIKNDLQNRLSQFESYILLNTNMINVMHEDITLRVKWKKEFKDEQTKRKEVYFQDKVKST